MDLSTLGVGARPDRDPQADRDELIVRYEQAVEAEHAEQARYLIARLRLNDRLADFDRGVGRL